MMLHRLAEQGEFNRTCSTHLFQNLTKAGIAPMWANIDAGPRGGAVFFCYDSHKTCLRLMPNTPKLFQATLRSDLLSHSDATRLSQKLIQTIATLRSSYSGFFSSQYREGRIAHILEQADSNNDFGLHEAHASLAPDDLFAAIPWPCVPDTHFRFGTFFPAGIRADYFEAAVRDIPRAISIAIDVVTLGPSAGFCIETMLNVLDWLKAGRRDNARLHLERFENPELRKILVPSLAGGFQGIVFGIFNRLPTDLEPLVISQLMQFAATLGDYVAAQRDLKYEQALNQATSLTANTYAVLGLLPPVEHLLCIAGKQKVGLKLQREGTFLAGYRLMEAEELAVALKDPLNRPINPHEGDASLQAYVRMPDGDALSPVLTTLRLRPRLLRLAAPLPKQSDLLSLIELGTLRHALRRQLKAERGAIAASKKLFFVDLVLRNYERAEMILTNRKAKEYTENLLGRSVAGYHVAGKAAAKFEADTHKMLPSRFTFESISSHSIRVRWNPQVDSQIALSEIEFAGN